MTDPLTPLSDEDLSAALDGMATPDVDARIQADPAARARLEHLKAASSAVAQDPPAILDPAVIDALVAQAIERGTAPASETAGVVTPLAPRRRTAAGTQRWLVAAAVVVLMAIGLGFVYSGTHSDDTQDAGVALEDGRAASQDDSPSPEPQVSSSAEQGEDSAETPPDHGAPGQPNQAVPDDPSDETSPDSDAQAPAELTELGTFDDKDALRTELRAGFPQDAQLAEGMRPTEANVTRCNNFIQTVLVDLSLSTDPDAVGQATVADKTYLVYEYAIDGGTEGRSKLLTAADLDSCDLLFSFVR